MSGPNHLQRLREFLLASFSEHELRQLLTDRHGVEVGFALPVGGSPAQFFDAAVTLLDRRGLIDEGLFRELAAAVPARREQVEQLAEAWRQVSTFPPSDRKPTTTRPPALGYVYAIVEISAEGPAHAVTLQAGTCTCGVGLLGLARERGSLELVAMDACIAVAAQEVEVFVRMRGPHILRDHDRFLLGDTLTEVHLAAGHPVLELRGGGRGVVVPLAGSLRLGRAAPGVRVPQDPRMSRYHAQIDALHGEFTAGPVGAGPAFMLTDVGSANGTWLGIRERHRLSHGDEFRVHDGTFRVEITLRR